MIATGHIEVLTTLRPEIAGELIDILEYWKNNSVDRTNGGFWGTVDNDNKPDSTACKGVVLNSRILWTFSAAYCRDRNQAWLDIAARAYRYIVDYFIDRKYGGVFWSVDSKGQVLDARKQIYGLAFCIYGLSEYYKATREGMALHLSVSLFKQIEENSFDKKAGGYFEAFTQGWKPLDDMRLSEKDNNEKKTMNTHLHIVEAYANLFSIWKDDQLLESIKHLLDVFDQHFIDSESSHIRLFMDEKWNSRSALISYGHEIEAAWLLLRCAETIRQDYYIDRFRQLSIRLTEAAAEGLDSDGGLWYELDPENGGLIKEKHSWPQAEAMIGFLNAYQLTGDQKYLQHFRGVWEFVKYYIKDYKNGEWFWGVHSDYSVMQKEKAGFWKCPYHNSRACIEVLSRIGS